MNTEALKIWKTTVPDTWIDYNAHMTEGYYGVAFAEASDELLLHLGFDADYREASGTFYTVEAQIRFLEEVKEGSQICTETLLTGFDSKRSHGHHGHFLDNQSSPVATQEAVLLHVTKINGTPGVSEIRDPVAKNVKELFDLQSTIPRPSYLGNGIRQI